VRHHRVWEQGIEHVVNNPAALRDLAVFHRYERWALSRRKFGIRALAAACASTRTAPVMSRWLKLLEGL
jgi:hypothetical protein